MVVPIQLLSKAPEFTRTFLLAMVAGGWPHLASDQFKQVSRFCLLHVRPGFRPSLPGRTSCQSTVHEVLVDFKPVAHEGDFQFFSVDPTTKGVENVLGKMIVTFRLWKVAGRFFNLAHDQMPLIGEDRWLFSREVPQRDLALAARGSGFSRLERQSRQQQTAENRPVPQGRGAKEFQRCQAVPASFR